MKKHNIGKINKCVLCANFPVGTGSLWQNLYEEVCRECIHVSYKTRFIMACLLKKEFESSGVD